MTSKELEVLIYNDILGDQPEVQRIVQLEAEGRKACQEESKYWIIIIE